MSFFRYLVRRAAFALVSVYAVVTVVFFLINMIVWNELRDMLAFAAYGGATEEELRELREGFIQARNLDAPIYERYVGWLIDVTTLQWGYSFSYREPVIAVLDGRVPRTLEYVIPGVLLAILLGMVFGLVAALAKNGPFDWTVRIGAYALFGVPSFMVIIYYQYLSDLSAVLPTLGDHVLASLTVAAGLLAGQLRFARTAALEESGRAFVKMLRAKGASRLRTARHVLRNAAIPIVSMSIAELLTVLVLSIYVIESVLGIRGLARASLRAVTEGDVPLVIWTTMVIVIIGIVGNFLQDVLYGYLDPRIESG